MKQNLHRRSARPWQIRHGSRPETVRAGLLAGYVCAAAACLSWAALAAAQEAEDPGGAQAERRGFMLEIQGPIGPATRDYVNRGLEESARRGAELVVLRLDTPGGLDASTRDIIKAILESPVPVVTWVAPEGARATSAGTYILYASHVAAMSPATHVGAATPVAIVGGGHGPDDGKQPEAGDGEEAEQPDDARPADPGDAMSRKAISDSVAYIRSLAKLRGRNEEWAERAVREAESITSQEALELGVIDVIAGSLGELLQSIDGQSVTLRGLEHTVASQGLVIERIEPDWRNELLAVITSPTIAYLLLLVGVYGLILEGYNPGALLPGVVGAICLLLALYALQMLPVNYAGLALIVLGILLMIAEVMAPSFGVLGFGGVIAMVIGSIILIDTDVPGLAVSRPLIGAIATVASLGLMAIIGFAVKARQRPVVSGREQLVGEIGVAQDSFEGEGHVYVHSERWNALAEAPVREGQTVIITGLEGLRLKVRPVDQSEPRS